MSAIARELSISSDRSQRLRTGERTFPELPAEKYATLPPNRLPELASPHRPAFSRNQDPFRTLCRCATPILRLCWRQLAVCAATVCLAPYVLRASRRPLDCLVPGAVLKCHSTTRARAIVRGEGGPPEWHGSTAHFCSARDQEISRPRRRASMLSPSTSAENAIAA
jgi:hypothetical protein